MIEMVMDVQGVWSTFDAFGADLQRGDEVIAMGIREDALTPGTVYSFSEEGIVVEWFAGLGRLYAQSAPLPSRYIAKAKPYD